MMVEKITFEQLLEMLEDETVDPQVLMGYLVEDEENSQPFAPYFRPNWDLVDDQGMESGLFLNVFNKWARGKRRKEYRKKIAEGWPGVRIVSEGDSWFQYPIKLKDVIDQLSEHYAIFSLGAGGDELWEMIKQDEILAAVQAEKPDVLMLSAGGNDLVGNGRLEKLVHSYSDNRAAKDYPNEDFDKLLNKIVGQYNGLFRKVLAASPEIKILCHGYDRPLPTPGKGQWMGKPLSKAGIKKKALQHEIMAVIIDNFNYALKAAADDFIGAVHFVDCRDSVLPSQWHNELHPDNDGFTSVAGRFKTVIDAVTSRGMETYQGAHLAQCPGREGMMKDALDLDEKSFARVVARRTRVLTNARVPIGANRNARRQQEEDIAQYFEKVHLSSDFLPAHFLSDGVKRSAAVCRIKTSTSWGSGSLVASGNYILTNNHVLKSKDVAAGSVAQFGYENDTEMTEIKLRPDRFFITDETLDFTIVACDGESLGEVTPIPLLRDPATATRGDRVNIIQHPRGRKKEIALHENKVTRIKDRVLHYTTDTEPGSSGSPVFNNRWQLVGLHHAGWGEGSGVTNEGIRISAIVSHLLGRSRNEGLNHGLADLLASVEGTSPMLGFFDLEGVVGEDSLEVELPDFKGSSDFADIGFWNIEHFRNSVGDERIGKVAEVLGRLSLDVMGLVEVEEDALDRLVSALVERGGNMDYVLHDVRGAQDLAVLFDADTTTVTLDRDIYERHKDALATQTRTTRTAFPRTPLFARCSVKEPNRKSVEFMMIVVHLKAFGDAQSRERRRLAAGILAEIIEDIRMRLNLPVVLGGDFNEVLNTDVLSALTQTPDLFALTMDDALGGAMSYVGASHRSLIDHIIVSSDVRPGDVGGDDAAIVRLDRSVQDFVRDVSDHVPVIMRIVGRDAPIDIGDTLDNGSIVPVAIPAGSSRVSLNFS